MCAIERIEESTFDGCLQMGDVVFKEIEPLSFRVFDVLFSDIGIFYPRLLK